MSHHSFSGVVFCLTRAQVFKRIGYTLASVSLANAVEERAAYDLCFSILAARSFAPIQSLARPPPAISILPAKGTSLCAARPLPTIYTDCVSLFASKVTKERLYEIRLNCRFGGGFRHTQIEASFVGRNVGSRRRTRQEPSFWGKT